MRRFFSLDQGSQDGGAAVDLFGNPVQVFRDPRGRPKYAKNEENQQLVIQFSALGWRQADIAAFMGCDEKTLRKHFSRELDHGALFLEGMAMQVLVRKMMDGNVAATREVLAIAQAAHAPKGKTPGAAPEARPPKLGKKQLQDRDARVPPDNWGELLN